MIEPTTAVALPSPRQSRPKKRINRSRRQWQSLLDDFHRSGLTKVAFCKQHGVATSSLNRWQRMLESQTESSDFINVTEPLSHAPTIPAPSREGDNGWQVELELGKDIVLKIRTA